MTAHVYQGPKPALHAALTELAEALAPQFAASWIPDDPNDPDPWRSGHFDTEHPPESEADRAARQWSAVARFRSGLDVLAERGDVDALRVRAAMVAEDEYAAAPKAIGRRSPSYGPLLDEALARLVADSEPPALGDVTAWCPTCKRKRVVVEVDPTATAYVGNDEVEWTATHLACSHTLQGPERIVGRSPGGEAAAEALTGAATQRRLARSAAMQDDA